jgi:very-short-patch-repair endonuclease
MSIAENRMWYFLRNRRFNGYKFVQFCNNEFFLDVYGVLETILRSIEDMPDERALIRRCAPPSPQVEKGNLII